MSDVKRYEPEGSFDGCAGWMRPEIAGDWVSFDDYTALRARLGEVTEERNVQNDLRQIAEDAADELRARAERAEAALAQLQPRDGERWVTPDMIQYQYEWMEWLAGDQPLVPIDDLRAVQAALALRNGECEAKKIIIAQLEAALATARRDALGLCRDIAMQALTGDADGRDIYEQIDALASEADTSARGMP